MQQPQITIDGKKYVMPRKPKMILWRSIVKFEEEYKNGDIQGQQILDELYSLVSVAFNNPAVTPKAVEINYDFEEIMNLFTYISEYVKDLANKMAARIPKNSIAPTKI